MIDLSKISIEQTLVSRISETDADELPFGKIFSDHMFIADFHDGKWGDMRIVPYGSIAVAPGTPAIQYGQCIFEGMKAYRGWDGQTILFRPLDHLKRMNLSAERMCMPAIEESMFMESLSELLNLDRQWVPSQPGHALYIRPFLFSDEEYIGVRPSKNFKFMIITCPVGLYYKKPLRVRIETEYTRAIAGGVGYVKAGGNYGGAIYPTELAHQQGYDQLIWTDGKKHECIEESGAMNIMFLINGTLVTPSLSDSILAGITRDSVLMLARRRGFPVEERKVLVSEIEECLVSGSLTEAFGTGTAATITPIQTIGYRNNVYQLAIPTENSLSIQILKELSAIRRGRQEDTLGWTHPI